MLLEMPCLLDQLPKLGLEQMEQVLFNSDGLVTNP